MKTKLLISLFLIIFSGCKKLLEIPNPENISPPEKVFATQSDANEAIAGIYKSWKNLYNNISSPSILGGLSSDELENYSFDQNLEQFEKNDISTSNLYLPWAALYNIIYQANSAIEGLNKSTSIDSSFQKYYLGEAKFIRAHSYFILVNFFGDVPLLKTTDIKINRSASRSSVESVYVQIIQDLVEAENLLESSIFPEDYKYRIHKLVVSAFLARVYLYKRNWAKAQEAADKVINSNKYHLVENIDSVTRKNNTEALLQFDDNGIDGIVEPAFYAFDESPILVLRDNFVNSIENSDLRKDKWISSKLYQNKTFYYPFKYKSLNFVGDERYSMFRLAEQYLIRAEARANNNQIEAAVEDINIIRGRANLPLISSDIDFDSCMNSILKERRIELLAESSHRWFDLKRLGYSSDIISKLKSSWLPSDNLYPLPIIDVTRNSNLDQNPGYK